VPKPWQPLNVLVVAEQALAYARSGLGSAAIIRQHGGMIGLEPGTTSRRAE
jgi:hypothetical protein